MPSKSVLIAQAFSEKGVLSTVTDSAPSVNTGQIDVATAESLPATGNTAGDQAFVADTNKLFVWSGAGWYNIAIVNESPTWDSGGQPGASFVLDPDSPQDATIITLSASDPEGFPISYSYETGGSMDSIATISQDSSVFTITPKTSTQVPDGGTGSITFRATDGVNILPAVSSFTLNFITIIANSKLTIMHANAVGTGNNESITDSSTNNTSISVDGDGVFQGGLSPYRQYSTYFPDTAGDAYVSANSSDYELGTGALTVSAWLYVDNNTQEQTIVDNQTGAGTGWYFKVWPGQLIRVHNQSSYIFNIANSDAPTAVNEWMHLCWTRDGSGNNKLFLNGSQVGTTVSDTTNFTAQGCKLGETYQGSHDFKGYMKDVHIVAGYANEPTAASITTPATAGTGTVFLGCSEANFLDKSSSPKTITERINYIYTRQFSPFDREPYDKTVNGGSITVNEANKKITATESSDELSVGTSDFTLKFWHYSTDTNTTVNYLFRKGTNTSAAGYYAMQHYPDTNNGDRIRLTFRDGGGSWNSSFSGYGAFKRQAWNYIEWWQPSSGSGHVKINGESVITTTGANLGVSSEKNLELFNNTNTSTTGRHWADFQVVKGDARESTVPTAPMSTHSSAGLHLKGIGAAVVDASQTTNIETVGSAAGASSPVKFSGTYSMYFPGVGHWMPAPMNGAPKLAGTEDWTVEAWVYPTSRQSYSTVVSCGDSFNLACGMVSGNFHVYNRVRGGYGDTAVNHGTYDIPANQWTHLAATRVNGVFYTYVDGTLRYTRNYSADISHSMSEDPYCIGAIDGFSSFSGNERWFGNIQDVRITKGLARYTTNFTPPTEPLEG